MFLIDGKDKRFVAVSVIGLTSYRASLKVLFYDLVFLMFIWNELFCLTQMTVCNFVDNTNFFACEIDLKFLMKRLEHNCGVTIWVLFINLEVSQQKSQF